MKNDLTCGVVRDLLPSYVEGLLGEESQQAVDRHLAGCSPCSAILASMRETGPEAAEQAREVDYLKRVKLRSNRRIAAAVVCTGLVLLSVFLAKLFIIGSPLQPEGIMVMDAAVEADVLRLSLMSQGSANAFHGWQVKTEDGVSSIYARDVLVSPLYSSGSALLEIPLEGVQEVWLGGTAGRLLWQDGAVISPLALELLNARAPYCGDPTALARIAEILRLPDRLGSYTISLQTSKRPYGCTLVFANQLNDEQLSMAGCFALLSLALVDNLEVSRFTYPVSKDLSGPAETAAGGMQLDMVNETVLPALTEEYNAARGTNWAPKASIKDCARTPADLQRLLQLLDLSYGTALSA